MDCGCGRSPTGKCIGWHKLSEEEYLEAKKNYQEKEKAEDQLIVNILLIKGNQSQVIFLIKAISFSSQAEPSCLKIS